MSAISPDTGTPFGPYRILRELGRGGMGTVYLAEVAAPARTEASPDTEATGEFRTAELLLLPEGAKVALKTFHPHLVSTKDFARRFRREARVGASIQHPNVVRTLDAGTYALHGVPTNYLAMEYIEGQTLRELMKETGRLPEELARTIARQVASALSAIHRAGITHRDLKPENVILTRDHRVKLMDLGVAKVREESIRLSLTGQFLGSVHYAAPEQFRAPETVDARADLYALGVLLYEMLAGSNPFFHDDLRVVLRKTLSEMPRRLTLVAPEVSPVHDQLAWALISKDPAERLQTADEIVDVLEHGDESAWWRGSGRRAWSQSAGRAIRRLSVPREAPICGRDDELTVLRQQFELAAGGRRRVVLIEGEAGIGKTRLVDEFVAALAERGTKFRFAFGAAQPAGTGRPLHAFSAALLRAIEPEDPARALLMLLPQGAPVEEFVALVTGGPGADMDVDRARPLFAAAFRALAAKEPLVLFVDELHLAGENSARLLSWLAHDDPATPLLVLAAYRSPDEGHPLHAVVHSGRAENVVQLPLGRLGPRDIGVMLRNVLRSERLVQELGFRLLEKTEGNPFFLLEVLRSLQQDHVLRRRDDGAWTLAGTRVEIHVPDSVRDLIQTQLARLPDEDRELLDVAAVAGTEFDPDLLAEVLGQPKLAVLRKLSQLERRNHLVRAVGRRVRFDHHQLRETLYEGLMEGLREEYHAQIGEALLRRRAGSKSPPDGAAHLELLHHLALGARPEAAAAHVLPALAHAAGKYETERGLRLAQRFLDISADTADVTLRTDVRIALAGFLEHEGARAEERKVIDAARAEIEPSGDAARMRKIIERSLLLAFGTGDFEAAAAHCRESLRLATRTKNRDVGLAAIVNLAAALRCQGRYDDAARALGRALRWVIRPESVLRRTIVLASLAMVEAQRGRRAAAQERFLEAISAATPFGIGAAGDLSESRHPEHDELRDRFVGLSRALGRSAEARVDGERAVLIESDFPRRLREGGALLALAAVAAHLGLDDDARGLLVGALRAGREAGEARFQGAVLQALGENAIESRAPEVARKWFAEALEIRRRIGHRPGVCETLLALGQLAALGGSVEAARPYLEEAMDLAPELEMPAIAALARATSALLHAREGRRDRAREELNEARDALVAPGPLSVSSRVEGLWFAALAARTLGDDEASRQHVLRAWDILQTVSRRMRADERDAFLSGSSPNREIRAAAAATLTSPG